MKFKVHSILLLTQKISTSDLSREQKIKAFAVYPVRGDYLGKGYFEY
jgi:hypothetical protein